MLIRSLDLFSFLTDYTSLYDAYPGFDWFATTIFLLMGCDDVRTWRWLRTFALLLPAGFLWHARLFNTVNHRSDRTSDRFDSVIIFSAVHQH